ncbi:MAG: EF-P lysine aminoacylase GenX [Simkania sp.]|nr:EF-P lysine aminoacylase GenX [Simkania sp.]
MNTFPGFNNRLAILKDRSVCLAKARSFFTERGVLEVDTPILSHTAPIDVHIDILRVLLPHDQLGYLHSSPEYAMKRLLIEGLGDIYQLGHVFREGEFGALHNPEFTMAEWYRIGVAYNTFIEETLEFVRCFLGKLPSEALSYREALLRYADIDYLLASKDDLLARIKHYHIDLHGDPRSWKRGALLDLLLSFVVEPHLGQEKLTILCDYPASAAALACTRYKGDEHVAERFEVYYQGIELANGYHELADPAELRRRFEEANTIRQSSGKVPLPIDEHFLSALERGLPDSCGVAVGFDRLMLLRHRAKNLHEILPFTWDFV